jgi:RHS repeat-associated protein
LELVQQTHVADLKQLRTVRLAAGEENYNIFRWYRAGWGRYTQNDPLERETSAIQNGYRYALSNPLSLDDPTGLEVPHEADKINCLKNPIECVKVHHCAQAAVEASTNKCHYNLDGTPQSAYRHCYWSCCMAKIIGADEAKKFGDAHEDYPGNSKCDKDVDLYNNEQGRKVSGGMSCDHHCSTVHLQQWRSCEPCGRPNFLQYYKPPSW